MRRYLSIDSCIFFTSFFFVLTSCESLFIPDPVDPRLPKYTEDGNGVAGAFINGKTWRSEVFYGLMYGPDNMPVINSFPRGDSLSIYFFGEIENGQDFQTSDKIGFYLKNVNVQSFVQLTELKGQKFSLDGVNSYGAYQSYKGGVGQLYLKNVTLNDSLDRVTISGTFGFSVPDENGEEIDVHYGRFDYKVSTSYFRAYP